jgi:small subunit ribosomal protein S4
MKIGPKFKIAKRLGAPVFEKTQSQKFALSEARKGGKTAKRKPGQMSDYKRQLLEKQKMRYVYGLTEKQLRRYVDEALVATNNQPILALCTRLEERLDNVAFRLGLAKTRRFARQMVSHGHITVNGKKMTIPSYKVNTGDIVSVREGSKASPMYLNFTDTFVHTTVPSWLTMDAKKLEGKVVGAPQYNKAETLFDPEQVFEFYSR